MLKNKILEFLIFQKQWILNYSKKNSILHELEKS